MRVQGKVHGDQGVKYGITRTDPPPNDREKSRSGTEYKDSGRGKGSEVRAKEMGGRCMWGSGEVVGGGRRSRSGWGSRGWGWGWGWGLEMVHVRGKDYRGRRWGEMGMGWDGFDFMPVSVVVA